MYYRPDMGWEPVWHGLWINKAELTKENLPKQLKLKGANFLRLSKCIFPNDKNETEPVWLSPVFAIFQAPPCKVIRVKYAYNQTQVRPAYNK